MIAGGKRYIIHGRSTDVFHLWGIGDTHIGAKACAEHDLRRDIADIAKDPFALWIGLGDYADFIGYTDAKRFDPDAVADWISVKDLGKLGTVSMEKVRKLFEPIKKKCVGLLFGNHEKKYQQHQQQEDLHGALCVGLGVPNLGYCCFVDLVFCRTPGTKSPLLSDRSAGNACETFRIFAHHGSGYAQTPGGKLNRLDAFMHRFDADVYFCGHVHDRKGQRVVTIGADAACAKLKQVERVGMICGSYLKCYDEGANPTYGEQKGYAPVPLGPARLSIRPETREIHAEI